MISWPAMIPWLILAASTVAVFGIPVDRRAQVRDVDYLIFPSIISHPPIFNSQRKKKKFKFEIFPKPMCMKYFPNISQNDFWFICNLFQNDHNINKLDFQCGTKVLAWIISKIKYSIAIDPKLHFAKCGFNVGVWKFKMHQILCVNFQIIELLKLFTNSKSIFY